MQGAVWMPSTSDHALSFMRAFAKRGSTLPAAQIHVQFLIPELPRGGSPVQDLFHVLDLSQDDYGIESEPRNPSLYVSVHHVLSKNPNLFLTFTTTA